MSRRDRERENGNVFAGALLVILGVLFLADRMELADIGIFWRYWPAVFFATAISKFLSAGGPGRIGHGLMDLCLGVAFFALNFNWWGLSWWNGWPLILIAVGLGTVARALWRGNGREVAPDVAPAGSHAIVVDEEDRHA